jgi:hypothetical protein
MWLTNRTKFSDDYNQRRYEVEESTSSLGTGRVMRMPGAPAIVGRVGLLLILGHAYMG